MPWWPNNKLPKIEILSPGEDGGWGGAADSRNARWGRLSLRGPPLRIFDPIYGSK
jgi:hypothetical protein